jgi:hypothetical protein
MFKALKLQYKLVQMMVGDRMSEFEKDTRGDSPVRSLFMLLILAVFAGAAIPTAVQSVKAGNTSGFTAAELALYGLISIIIILCVVMLFARIVID